MFFIVFVSFLFVLYLVTRSIHWKVLIIYGFGYNQVLPIFVQWVGYRSIGLLVNSARLRNTRKLFRI